MKFRVVGLSIALAVVAFGPTVSAEQQLPGGHPPSKSPLSDVVPEACPQLSEKGVSESTILKALSDPSQVYGWGMCANPNLRCSSFNTPRRWLSVKDPGKKYDSFWNGLSFKGGCW
jgi:hypothetical protein